MGHDYETWQYEINLMYSVYSFPNMFLPLLGGILIDKLNPVWVLIGFSLTVCLGQTLFALGVSSKYFALMLVGRILFGIGGESISVAQASITTSWFKNKELAFALGLNLCIARLGSVTNTIMSPRIAAFLSAPMAVWTGAFTCYFSLVCALILAHIMSKKESKLSKKDSQENINTPSSMDSSREPLLSSSSVMQDIQTAQSHPPSNTVSDFTLLPTSFWILCLICILLYGTVVPFNNIAQDFLTSKWYPDDIQMAGLVMSIPDSMSAILVPFCGIFVDFYGGRASSLIICSLLIMGVHLTLGLTQITPILPLIFLGMSYSIYGVAIWPSIATITEHEEAKLAILHGQDRVPKLVGTAFGISTSVLNAALTIFPLISVSI